MVGLPVLRTLLALYGGGIFKHIACFDIGNAFASAPAQRRVVVEQPPGYYDGTQTYLELLRILYGQSDAGRGFWIHLEEVLLKFGLERSDADPCTFSRGSIENGDLFVVCR